LRYLLIPGINGSGPDHWQTPWELALGDAAARIAPGSWDEPVEEDWIAAVGRGIDALTSSAASPERVVLVAHSLGCIAAGSRLVRGPRDERVAGAFLVAPPDREEPSVPGPAAAFALPTVPLRVPALVVASQDDPYLSPRRAAWLADAWGAGLVDAGAVGHINDESGLGDWPAGRALLTAFVAGLGG
jgi:predicted alpha/beta hydrolase family esterase